MSYIKEYAQKLITAKEAANMIKSGDWVDYGWTTATTAAVDKEIAARAEELENVNFRGGILMWEPEIFKVENAADHFTWNSWHMSGFERRAVSKGFAYYAPVKYSELPRYYRENIKHVDVAIFQVAPMDKHGYFNFGPNASHMMAVCEVSDIVIVEVNENMPRCLGGFEEAVHISDVDYIVEGENPAMAVHNAVVTEECAKMAFRTEVLRPDVRPAPQVLLDKHYLRKHGANAYYGQK